MPINPTPVSAPIPVCPEAFNKVNWGSDVCNLLKELLLTNDKLKRFWEWMMEPDTGDACFLSKDVAAQLVGLANPIGSGFWSPFPLAHLDKYEWMECAGQAVPKIGAFAPLYAAVGDLYTPVSHTDGTTFIMPNLSGRLMMNHGQRPKEGETEFPNYIVDIAFGKGGNETLILESGQIPGDNHYHGWGGVLGGQPDHTTGAMDQYYSRADGAGKPNATYQGFSSWGDGHTIGNTANYKDNIKRSHLLTTEPLGAHDIPPPAEGEEEEEVDPVSVMNPYHVGVYYVRCNYKIRDGQYLFPITLPDNTPTPIP